jgi:hypothetical protein
MLPTLGVTTIDGQTVGKQRRRWKKKRERRVVGGNRELRVRRQA